MISQKMADAINVQIKEEFYSAYLYLAMAYKSEELGLKVFAEWFQHQEAEERMHATKMAQYLLDQGAEVTLLQLDQPKYDKSSISAMIDETVKHEKFITNCISDLVNLARDEKDNATFNFLQWYVEEQVEEVASVSELQDLVKLAGPDQLLILEERLRQLVAARNSAE
ncbi:MAG: ferritin [Calditrichaeota bacterium]|nr:MAG: ferritin [Calditrichota bacterium]